MTSINCLQYIIDKYTKFDYIFERDYHDTIIQYGIIEGNNKILLIKPGLNGSLTGYKDKYYNLATYINETYGYTIICTNNPHDKTHDTLFDAIEVIESYVNHMNFKDYDIYYYGNSNGGIIGACNGYKYPSIKRMLLINPPLFINYHKMEEGIENFKGDKIIFIFGELDPSSKYTGLLDLYNKDNISYYILQNEDHNLSNNTVSLEYLVEEYLLKD